MDLVIHPLEASGNDLLSTETIPSVKVPANFSVADEPSTTQLQLSITLERLRLESAEKERLLEQLRASGAAEERKFRAEQAEKDRELEKFRIESNSDQHGSGSWRKKLEDFAESTSMPGAPKIIFHKSLIRRLVWLLCFFGSWTMFFIQTQLVFRNYFTYPKNTQVEIVSEYPQFPDLTFCFRRGVSFYDAHEWLMRKYERRIRNETLESIMADMKVIDSIMDDVFRIDPIFHSVKFQRFINRSAISKEEVFFNLILERGTKSSVVEEKLVNAMEEVFEIPGGKFLKCFTVPVAKYIKKHDVRVGIVSADGHLLTGSGMILDMSGESEYPWKDISSEEGAIVYIHQPGVKINPMYDTQFYNLQPNHDYKFLVNAKQHVRLGHPYGQCSSWDPFLQGGQNRSDVPYRQKDCELACMSKQILDRYGAVLMWYPPPDGMRCWVDENGALVEYKDNEGDTRSHVRRWCNNTKVESASGNPGGVVSTQDPNALVGVVFSDCPCYPPCDEIEYDVSVTSRPNPFRSNSDEIELYWSSKIGGQLGVWIGISIITLVEVIELLVDLCGGCLRRGRKKELETSDGTTRQDGDIV